MTATRVWASAFDMSGCTKWLAAAAAEENTCSKCHETGIQWNRNAAGAPAGLGTNNSRADGAYARCFDVENFNCSVISGLRASARMRARGRGCERLFRVWKEESRRFVVNAVTWAHKLSLFHGLPFKWRADFVGDCHKSHMLLWKWERKLGLFQWFISIKGISLVNFIFIGRNLVCVSSINREFSHRYIRRKRSIILKSVQQTLVQFLVKF